jgi:hypothetical protein
MEVVQVTETIVAEVRAGDLPAVVRKAIAVTAGEQVTVTHRADGSVGLYGPRTPVPEDDSWLDSPYWQSAIDEAAAAVREGRTSVYLSAEEFFAALEKA